MSADFPGNCLVSTCSTYPRPARRHVCGCRWPLNVRRFSKSHTHWRAQHPQCRHLDMSCACVPDHNPSSLLLRAFSPHSHNHRRRRPRKPVTISTCTHPPAADQSRHARCSRVTRHWPDPHCVKCVIACSAVLFMNGDTMMAIVSSPIISPCPSSLCLGIVSLIFIICSRCNRFRNPALVSDD